MVNRRKKSAEPEPSGHSCYWAGCAAAGDYKAPKARHAPGQYQWFCLEHIRAFNQNWNYFEGMSEDQIYAFQKDATLGHRPTWKSGINPGQKLEDALHRFFTGDKATIVAALNPINGKDKQALALLDLEHPADKKTIKTRYRAMVKKHHPDVNSGNSKAEEAFKKVVQAYEHLLKHYLRD
jgi:DnaJ-domain-containing protein 1